MSWVACPVAYRVRERSGAGVGGDALGADGRRSVLGVFGVEDDVPGGFGTDAFGAKARSGDGEVEVAAVAGVEWGKDVGDGGGTDPVNGGIRHTPEVVFAAGPELPAVEGDAVSVGVVEAEDVGGDALDGVEEFAVVGEQGGGVATGEVDENSGLPWGGRRLGEDYAGLKLETRGLRQ